MTLLVATLTLALEACGLAMLVHALVPKRWRAVKPWGCALCMSAWCSLIVAVTVFAYGATPLSAFDMFLSAGGAIPISVWLLTNTVMRSDPFGGMPPDAPM